MTANPKAPHEICANDSRQLIDKESSPNKVIIDQPSDGNCQICEGILLVDKPKGLTSFRLVQILRKRFHVQKIGHAGTLDPFATGVMVMLVGRNFTRLSNDFLNSDKEYLAEVYFGKTTDTFDIDGVVLKESSFVPSLEQVQEALLQFQGEIMQVPPMYSAKKVAGKRLYELARKGIDIKREALKITCHVTLLRYEYPYLELRIACSKGTYIRSIAHDLGEYLGCGAHLSNLKRVRCGKFHIENCVSAEDFSSPSFDLKSKLKF